MAPDHETGLVEPYCGKTSKTLDMYSKMHERFEKDGTMAGSEGNRQVSRRESVKCSTQFSMIWSI